jgi:hypothetical protein
MNGVVDTYAFERRQARFIRLMMVLSLLFHGGVVILGSAVSSLFPAAVYTTVVTVELTDAPMSTIPEELSAPPVLRAKADSAVSKDIPSPRKKGPEPPSAQRWLEKLDAGLARVPDAPVARKTGKTGGIPVRHWENEASPRAGDFPPAVTPEKNLLLGKQLEDLENRVRKSGHPGVGVGNEAEASMMFGGTESAAGESIPPWIRDMIRRKVRGYLPELESAYSVALRRNPELKGRLMIRFRIDASGKIQQAESMEASFRDAPFMAAIVEKVLRWTFEPTGGRTVEVLYPFVFMAPS